MTKYVWSITKNLFEWTPSGINYTSEYMMDYVNSIFLGKRDPNLRDDQRSPLWNIEEGFDTPEHFAALLAKCFGWNVTLEEAPDEFRKWHDKNAEPYFIEECGGPGDN